jgi:hypothetical protein
MGLGKEREGRARGSGIIPKIEMISFRIVEVYGLLDEAKAKYIGIEIKVTLWVARDRGYVVQAHNGFGWHLATPSL